MSNVIDISPVVRQLRGDGEPPDNDGMAARVAKLETLVEKSGDRLTVIEKDLAVLRTQSTQYATKEDLATAKGELRAAVAEAKNSIIMWVVSAILLAQVVPQLMKKFGL